MDPTYPAPLGLTRTVLRLLNGLNLVYGAIILGLLIWSFPAQDKVMQALGFPPEVTHQMFVLGGLRLVVLIGVASVPLAYIILTKLREIVDTVRAGDPFIAGNAGRLRNIAWSLLGLELLHLAVGGVIAVVAKEAKPFVIDFDWNFSVTGWLAVLLLFVLASVFDQGTRMRDDLEGTV